MTESKKPKVFESIPQRDVWRTYFQAALTGMLARGENIEATGMVQKWVEISGWVADAAIEEEGRRKPAQGVGVETL